MLIAVFDPRTYMNMIYGHVSTQLEELCWCMQEDSDNSYSPLDLFDVPIFGFMFVLLSVVILVFILVGLSKHRTNKSLAAKDYVMKF